MEQKLYDAAAKLPETSLDFPTIPSASKSKPNYKTWKAIASLAACFILLIGIGFITVEAKEYKDAVAFFGEHGLSTDGLSRNDIKAVYRDITTKSFTYSKTAEVITSSLTTEQIGGYEILQNNPTPQELETLWNYKNCAGGFPPPNHQGIHYMYRFELKEHEQLGFSVHDKSFIEKYNGDTLLWSFSVSEFVINGHCIVSDGIIVYGSSPILSSSDKAFAWIVKIDSTGNFLWKRMLHHDFGKEYISEIIENTDGSYAVISRGDLKHFCLSQYTAEGEETGFKKTEVGRYEVGNAALFGDGYIVQFRSRQSNNDKIVKVDHEGNVTDAFSYSGEDAYYYITDMISYNGNIYLSAYSVPKLADENKNAGGRYEIAAILNYLSDNNIWEISNEELTPMVRDNYTALLLMCDPSTGTPQEFYSVKGSLGDKLSLSDSGMLLWDVKNIVDTFYSPATSLFTIGGTCCVYRYTFDPSGILLNQEATGQVVDYMR